jgi:hypothetical protein
LGGGIAYPSVNIDAAALATVIVLAALVADSRSAFMFRRVANPG